MTAAARPGRRSGGSSAPARRYVTDGSWERFGSVLLAGSPLAIFRTTVAGTRVLESIEAGAEIEPSHLVDRLLDSGSIHPAIEDTSSSTWSRADVTIVTPQLGGTVLHGDRLIVDDGSEPALSGASRRLEVNSGPGAARNAGRSLVTTRLIAFVDADVDLGSGTTSASWLDAILPHFDDERIALVAPRVCGERNSPLDLGDEAARLRAGTRVAYAPAAAIVVRADAFDEIGGFDERLRFGEDVDLVWRLDQTGWRCRYEPASTVWHAPRQGWVERLRQHAGYGTSAAPLALRHPESLSPVHANGWTTAAWAALVCWHPLVAVGVVLASAAQLPAKLPGVPARRSVLIAIDGHLRAGRQFAEAVRRVWWPIALLGAILSRRVRWAVLAAVLASPSTAPTDAAYGYGVWVGVTRHRTAIPLLPRWNRWPGRRRH